MRRWHPSFTARWVAACRGLAGVLPPGEPICHDPWGLRLAGPEAQAVAVAARSSPRAAWHVVRLLRPVAHTLVWVQLRTRAIDDLLGRFVASGGRQVVVLGAGYDARSVRLREVLAGVRLFEVDHPPTQRRKRALLDPPAPDGPILRYLPWDFERDPIAALPRRLAESGHDPALPTFTLWEGVTMYLTERAVDETVGAVRAASAAGSTLVVEYLTARSLSGGSRLDRGLRLLAALGAEPFRFGWDPDDLPGWLARRGFALVEDEADAAVARRLLPPGRADELPRARAGWEFHLAVARPAEGGGATAS